MFLNIQNLKKAYEEEVIFDGFNMSLYEHEITCVLGPSGVGKSTLFNMIANIETYDSGTIEGLAHKRIAYVFQEDRLLEWKNVYDNIAFVIAEEKNIRMRVEEAIRSVKLTGYENYYPKELSGGMRQRVSLARAFVYKPDLMLMDEPFKGLDIALKEGIIDDFEAHWQKNKYCVIMSTHDIEEAIRLAQRIIVLGKKPVVAMADIDAKEMDKGHLRRQIKKHLEE